VAPGRPGRAGTRHRPTISLPGEGSTTFALLANIALATRARLDRDAQAERITNNDRANELLDHQYRPPWTHA
jgi:hypothetical protein